MSRPDRKITPAKLRILRALARGPCSPAELAERVSRSKTTVSLALKWLVERDFVRHGRYSREVSITSAGEAAAVSGDYRETPITSAGGGIRGPRADHIQDDPNAEPLAPSPPQEEEDGGPALPTIVPLADR